MTDEHKAKLNKLGLTLQGKTKPCPKCQGTGQLTHQGVTSDYEGSLIPYETCPDCDGTGVVKQDEAKQEISVAEAHKLITGEDFEGPVTQALEALDREFRHQKEALDYLYHRERARIIKDYGDRGIHE